ncbi:MAG: hypothetical protein IJM81_06735 [Prevotella sp.]|nr:hypothetical protein [Prevotella sp.]
MKTAKSITLLVSAALMVFASCGEKEGNTPAGNDNPGNNQNPQTEEMIVGNWNETVALYIYSQNGTCDTTSMFEDGESIVMTFNADKTYTSIYHSTDGDSEEDGTWAVTGDKLTLKTEFGPMDYTIDQLDASVFNVTHNEEDEDEDEDGSYSVSIIRMTKIAR